MKVFNFFSFMIIGSILMPIVNGLTDQGNENVIVDIKAVMPLSNLSPNSCIKSVSFGTKTYVTYEGQTSPDIQCMQGEKFVKDIYIIMRTIPRAQNGVRLP